MPNGISCAYFAIRNHVYGQKEQNIFKEGIAGAQTARTVSAAAESGLLNNSLLSPFSNVLGKAAGIAKKLVYPLIIASGIYNTAVSDDKVKTGASQAGGIAAMYTFEKGAEKGLKTLSKKFFSSDIAKNNKKARTMFYIAKGMMFVAASLTGYKAGSKISENIVDKIRANKSLKQNTDVNNSKDKNIERTLFEDMALK